MEIWLPIPGYEGLYDVSSIGRVRSPNRFGRLGFKILSPWKNPKGYVEYKLHKNKIQKKITGHVLVARAFIPNQENKPQVNHKKGIKDDNRYTELEWCTRKENIAHAVAIKLMKGNPKKVVNAKTGEIYESVIKMCESENKNKSSMYKKLNGIKTNDTPYAYKNK